MKNKYVMKLFLLSLFSCFMAMEVNAEDLVFDSFEEAEKAAEQREAEYNRRMKEQVAAVDKAWEKQKTDLGEGANYDITKITETRETEQTSDNEDNKKLQDSVTDSINGLKKQMTDAVSANTVGFAGASAAYCWSVKCKDGKYILSDSYDQAFFVSGADKVESALTNSGGNEMSGSKSDSKTDNATDSENDSPDSNNDEDPTNTTSDESETTNDEGDEKESNQDEANPPHNEVVREDANPVNDTPLSEADRVVELTIQHPTTFEEATFSISEGQTAKMLKLDKFSIPEDTRVKISAKANMEVENTTLTMTIVDDEGESDPIDSASMKNYRHLFRIPSNDEYFVNIYVNESGKDPRKIMQLCVPVVPVDFGTRTISR